MDEIGWALIGASFMAEDYVAGLIDVADGATMRGVFSSSLKRGRALAERCGLPRAYSSLDQHRDETPPEVLDLGRLAVEGDDLDLARHLRILYRCRRALTVGRIGSEHTLKVWITGEQRARQR